MLLSFIIQPPRSDFKYIQVIFESMRMKMSFSRKPNHSWSLYKFNLKITGINALSIRVK